MLLIQSVIFFLVECSTEEFLKISTKRSGPWDIPYQKHGKPQANKVGP